MTEEFVSTVDEVDYHFGLTLDCVAVLSQALQIGLEQKSRAFAEKGSELYVPSLMQDRHARPDIATMPSLETILEMEPAEMSDDQLRSYIERLQRLRKKDIRQILYDESHERPEHQGFIYIVSNPAMPGLIKIGSTEGSVETRIARLDSATGVPEPFKIEKRFAVYGSPKRIEKQIHSVLDIFRSRRNREFFRLSPEQAITLIGATLAKITGETTATKCFQEHG